VVLGACLGLGFCQIMKYSLRKNFIDRESYVAQYIALALMSIGLTSLLGSDDLLAAFAAGESLMFACREYA
jgi:sodium/hydrogen antiporter